MAPGNSFTSFGSLTKTLHWLTALLILTAFPLGMIADSLAYDTSDQLRQKALVFSLHKTIGITAFFVALLRILWALGQEKPGLLNAENRLESFAAELMHWMLYVSMLIVPLSGWLHHAATEGYAPVFLPFGDTLPLVPKSPAVAEFFAGWHFVFTKVLGLSVLLHVAGAVKHAVIDRDGTLRRMWFGAPIGTVPPAQTHSRAPLWVAAALYAVAIGAGSAIGLSHDDTRPTSDLAAVETDWQVVTGDLAITVRQNDAPIEGRFANWTAAIRFDETPADGVHGDVAVTIDIGSLSLGTITNQALGTDFFDAATFPTATFTATLRSADPGYLADGALSLRGFEVPIQMPFDLRIDGDTADMTGRVTLDRRDYEMGTGYPDENTVGFGVDVTVALTARRADG